MGNLVFKIGQLEYFRISLETDKTMYFIIAGAVGAVLLLFIVILVCYNRRKQKKAKEESGQHCEGAGNLGVQGGERMSRR